MERVADVAREDGCARGPLGGLFEDLDEPDATLAVALARVAALCAEGDCAISATELAVSIAVCDASGADTSLYSDRVRGSRTAGGIAALQMYTLEFRGTSVFAALNEALRSKVRARCAPFRRYIWMLMHAMREAPAFDGATIFRGVREDLRATYKKGRTVTWSGFSSCTSSLEVLQNEQFCGASEERTIFIIALTQGRARSIADVSMVETEDEVLLPPNTRVLVDSTLDAGGGLVLVSLTELEPLDPILSFGTSGEPLEVVADDAAEDECGIRVAWAENDEDEPSEAARVYSALPYGEAETQLKAAEQGDAESQYRIGFAYSYGDEHVDKAMAIAWYRKAAEQGHKEAQHAVGDAYYDGDGVQVDKCAAVSWWSKAAEQGHPLAQYAVGYAYVHGDGVSADVDVGISWYRKAAEQGHKEAQRFLEQYDAGPSQTAMEIDEGDAEARWLLREKDPRERAPDATSQYQMGYALYHGDRVRVDAAAGVEWLRKAAEQGHAEAQDLLGLAYFCGHGVPMDKAAAAGWQRKAAEQGNASAQFQLALAYFEGDGVPVDKVAGVVWLRQAAEQGHTHAQRRLGQAYHEGTVAPVDETAALEWWRKAEMSLRDAREQDEDAREQDEDDGLLVEEAEHGDEVAQYRMGLVLYYGDGAPVDKAAALGWWRKAAEQGHKEAQCFLDHYTEPIQTATEDAEAHFYRGLAYRDGSGVERDDALALKWLRKAAETHVDAQVELGHMLYVGDGVAKCRAESSRWYAKAREGGSQDALMLGRVYFNGDGVQRDVEEAVKWYAKAAEQGSMHAQYYMGAAYYNGDGVPVDKAAAVIFFRKAAEQGHMEAQCRMGSTYNNSGYGLPIDKAAAVEWWHKAAMQGHEDAQYRMGVAYFYGSGVQVSRAAAVEWWHKAAEQGHADAQYRMGCALYNGHGVPSNKATAVEWWKKAAAHGNKDALDLLTRADRNAAFRIIRRANNKADALEWWHHAAAQGDQDAKYRIRVISYGELLVRGARSSE